MSNLLSTVHYAKAAPRRLMLAFMLTTLLAPVSILNKLLFVALMTWTLILLFRVRAPRPQRMLPAFGIIGIFLYGYLLALPSANDHGLAFQFFLATFILALIHFVDFFKIDMDRAVEFSGKVMVGVSMIYWSLVLNSGLPYAQEIVSWYQEISQSASAERDFLGETPLMTLALSTAPFLYLPWCIVTMRIQRRFSWLDLMWLVLYGFTIALSGARGIVVVALLFLAYAGLTQASVITRVLLLALFASLLIVVLPELLSSTTLFSSDEFSNAIKIGHFQSFVDQLNWSNSIFGNGLGSFYFSAGKGALTQHTELTPIDLARYVGVPLAIAIYSLLLLPRLFRRPFQGKRKLVFAAFALYLLLSVTNPVLINSYGMLVVIWYWSKYRESNHDSSLRRSPMHKLGRVDVAAFHSKGTLT